VAHYDETKDLIYVDHDRSFPFSIPRAVGTLSARLSGVRRFVFRQDTIGYQSLLHWSPFFKRYPNLRKLFIVYGDEDDIKDLHRRIFEIKVGPFVWYQSRYRKRKAIYDPAQHRVTYREIFYYHAKNRGRELGPEIAIVVPREIPKSDQMGSD
jgi:hypothetical protein